METLKVNGMKLRAAWFALALAGLSVPAQLTAQETGNLPQSKAAATGQATAPATASAAAPAPTGPYWTKREQQLLVDFGDLERFKEADAALGSPAAGEERVVFLGDSITQLWKIEGPQGSFPGKPYINRGISGQTTPQMLVRFRQDVIDLKPKAVVILAGTNDLAGNTGPETLEEIENNLASMADLAAANRIRVVLCSVLPAFDFNWRPGLAPARKILALNAWIEAYAANKGYVYVDYHAAMKDERDGLPASLSKDGVHPTPAGYAIMAPLAEAGIEKALKAGTRD